MIDKLLYCSIIEQYKYQMKEIIFFGGGKLTFKIILNVLKKTEFTPILFAARRHLNEKIFDNETLKKHLLKKK